MWSKLVQKFRIARLGKVGYLRRSGARIGAGCEILSAVENFGSEPWLIDIGDRVTISHGVKLVTHDASTRLFRHRHAAMNRRFGNKFKPVRIGSDVFIGMDAIILPGVSIGEQVVVGAGAIVTDDVPARSVAIGVPARVVMTLDEYEAKCLASNVPIEAATRLDLRKELTTRFYGESL